MGNSPVPTHSTHSVVYFDLLTYNIAESVYAKFSPTHAHYEM